MTEAEWLASDDPVAMLDHAGVIGPAQGKGPAAAGRASARKLRLFACALFRALVARGTPFSENNHATIARVEARPDRPPPADPGGPHMGWAAPLRGDVARGIRNILAIPGLASGGRGSVRRPAQAALLREVFASPFRPPAVAPGAFGRDAVRLAQAAYRHRQTPSGHLDPVRLAVLADALEEAGADAEIVAHLRSKGPHVRGCWAIDLVLGKP